MREKIVNLLKEMGIPQSLCGYKYLINAIELYAIDQSYTKSVCKRLYPDVALLHQTTAVRVERSIRHAIEVAFKNPNTELVNKLFGDTIPKGKDKPTNTHFIAALTEAII